MAPLNRPASSWVLTPGGDLRYHYETSPQRQRRGVVETGTGSASE